MLATSGPAEEAGPEEEEAEEQQAAASEVDEVVIDPQVRNNYKSRKAFITP